MRVIFAQETPAPDNPFLDRFKGQPIEALVEAYNREVGNYGIVSARGKYLHVLYHELRRRGIDLSELTSEPRTLPLDHPVEYDPVHRKLRYRRLPPAQEPKARTQPTPPAPTPRWRGLRRWLEWLKLM